MQESKGVLALRRCIVAAKAAQLQMKQRAADSLAVAADALLAAAPHLSGALGTTDDDGRAALAQHLATLPCAPQVSQPTLQSQCSFGK